MKKKLMIALSIVLIIGIIILGYIFVSKMISPSLPRCEVGFRFVPASQSCESIMLEEEKIDLAQLSIQIPGENLSVRLEKSDQEGEYSAMFSMNSSDTGIKGFVSLSESEIVQYSEKLIAIPFLVNTGGTGQFLYLGLFDIELNQHLSSVFVGDRVGIDSLKMKNSRIHAEFKTRLSSESFMAQPTIPVEMVLDVNEGILNEVIRVENAFFSDIEIRSLPIASQNNMLNIRGAIPGNWYFEAIAQYRIFDNQYNEIAVGPIQALSDWMTVQRVPFELSISTSSLGYAGKAVVVIESANPQGGEEGGRLVKRIYIPVEIK